MALSSKLVVVVELSQRDRNYLRRIADAIAPLEGPGEADIDDEPTSTAGLGLPTGNKSRAGTPPPPSNRPYVDNVFGGDER